MTKVCLFPGCGTVVENARANTMWCSECRHRMNNCRADRRTGDAVRKALHPHAHRVDQRKHVERCLDGPREVDIKCKHCFGMPWARTSDRHNDKSGGYQCAVANENGVCRGCKLPWAPEPPPELQVSVRSSAAMNIDHGRLFGGEPTRNAYSQVTGRRKGAKGT